VRAASGFVLRQKSTFVRLPRLAQSSSVVDASVRQSSGSSGRPSGSWQMGHGMPGPAQSSCGHGRDGCCSQTKRARSHSGQGTMNFSLRFLELRSVGSGDERF
jgi:hypothetical protein